MKRLIAFLFLVLMLSAPASALTISSSTAQAGPLPALLLFPEETLSYDLSGTYTGLCQLEVSRDGTNYVPLAITGTSSQSVTGQVRNDSRHAYVRWNVISRAAGTFVTQLRDNDDFNREEVGHKKTSVLRLFDDSVRFPAQLVYENGSEVVLSSTTNLYPDNLPRVFNVLNSTGGAILMQTTPAISTSTYSDGTMYILQSATATVTFQDNGTLSGSLLELGSTTRALGVGDILVLVYRAGKWWEMGFYNN